MDAKSWEVVTPKPYFSIKFGCSNRAFLNDVKNELFQLAEDLGIEISDGYISEKCDFQGDLEQITIYRERGESGENLAKAVLHLYGVKEKVPEELAIVLSIF